MDDHIHDLGKSTKKGIGRKKQSILKVLPRDRGQSIITKMGGSSKNL